MMRFVPMLAILFVTGCTGLAVPADPCSILSDGDLGTIMGAPVGRKDAVTRVMGDETVATCDIDLRDGQWLTITLARRTTPITSATLATYTNHNVVWSGDAGFPVFYRTGEKDLEAFPAPDRRVHLRIGRNVGGGYAGSFAPDTAGKLRALLTAVANGG